MDDVPVEFSFVGERLLACREELRSLLGEERLSGATLLVLANKQDLPSAARVADIAKQSHYIIQKKPSYAAKAVYVSCRE
ncbi:hypothetical protein ANCDUO_06966 [Ancylostoma duodenale]|uniref:ADP-ribosylation factor family protein n=1 Tax=Ancylostoma duodenale TaxID=51022 RepID=A0A0C2DJS1_9BILA|nr:hypothetical protein ANCDUO_06966 [Ancylostoma duodenale]